MAMTRVVCFIAFAFLLFNLEASGFESRKKTEELSLGRINEDMARLLWVNCRLELIRVKDALEDLDLYILEYKSSGSNDFVLRSRASTSKNIKRPHVLHPKVKRTLLDCLRKKNLIFLASKEERGSKNWYPKYLEFLFARFDSPRRRQLLQVVFAEAPAPMPVVASPVSSPASYIDPAFSSSELPNSQRPTGPLQPFSQPDIYDSSVQPTPSTSSNSAPTVVVVAVVVTAAVTLLVAALLFLCYKKGCWTGSRRNDDWPLLSLRISSSQKPFALENSIKKENPGNQLFYVNNHNKVASLDGNFYMDSNILSTSKVETPLGTAAGAAIAEHSAQVPPSQLKPPPGRIGTPELPPLKPPPGRAHFAAPSTPGKAAPPPLPSPSLKLSSGAPRPPPPGPPPVQRPTLKPSSGAPPPPPPPPVPRPSLKPPTGTPRPPPRGPPPPPPIPSGIKTSPRPPTPLNGAPPPPRPPGRIGTPELPPLKPPPGRAHFAAPSTPGKAAPPPLPSPSLKLSSGAPRPPPPGPPPVQHPTLKPSSGAPPPPPPPPVPRPSLKPPTGTPRPPPRGPPPPPPIPSGIKTSPRPPPPLNGAPPPPRPPAMGLKPTRASALGLKHPSTIASAEGGEADAPKTKLKPFFWDKVLANPDHSMVWHQIKSGSFQFNEEMIESLFGYAPAEKNNNESTRESSSKDPSTQHVRIIDPKKSQNLSILLKALNVTTEEVCDALQEGNELPSDLLQTLLKMAPTEEEELKLRLYSGELSRLALSESFLKVLVDIPFAFKRLESLLFMCTLQDEASIAKESFATLEAACMELRKSRLFCKLLEAVLKTGNRMNDGTFRGGAKAFKLDTLLKLSDVKGTDGKTTLLHFVVQEIIRSEGVRAARAGKEKRTMASIKSDNVLEDSSQDSEEHYRSIGLQMVSGLGTELENVKKAAVLDADSLTSTVMKLCHALIKARDFLNSDMKSIDEENGFHQTLKSFVQNAEVHTTWLFEEEKRIMALVKSTAEYFHGTSGKDEGLRLFIIVRDFLIIVEKACIEVKDAPKKQNGTKRKTDSAGTPRQSPPDPRFLFAAITDRRMYMSSSDDDTA